MRIGLLLLSVFLISNVGQAKTFSTEYLSFNLSDDWSCARNGANWVCEPNNALSKRLSIITVSAKHAGPTDTLDSFQSFLGKPRSHQMGSKTPVLSQVMNNARRQLANWQWVQSMHLSSEIKDFYTLYLATVKNDIAIMITITAEKKQWEKFNPVFDKLISSLQLKNFQSPNKMAANSKGTAVGNAAGPGTTGASVNAANALNGTNGALSEDTPPAKSLPKVYIFGLGLAVLILGAAAYIFLKGN